MAHREAHRVGYGSMLLKKDFEGGLGAILIQEKHQTDKIDPRSEYPRFDCCPLASCCRLFQQHRSTAAVVPARLWSLLFTQQRASGAPVCLALAIRQRASRTRSRPLVGGQVVCSENPGLWLSDRSLPFGRSLDGRFSAAWLLSA